MWEIMGQVPDKFKNDVGVTTQKSDHDYGVLWHYKQKNDINFYKSNKNIMKEIKKIDKI